MLLCAVLAVVVVSANGCCAPERFSAYQLTAGLEMIKGSPKSEVGLSKFFHDGATERTAVVIEYAAEGGQNRMRIISDHRNKRRYIINTKTNACTVETINLPFRRFCTDSSRHLFEVNLGYGDNSLTARAFYKEMDSQDGRYKVGHVFLVSDACIPLQGDSFGLGQLNFLLATGWGSLSTDFDDSVFDPPPTCPTLTCSQKDDVNIFEIIRNKGALKYGKL
ncbi:uncharacterized protein [Haliotis cracherodii]|uniref:uncharacterized protein n=1 Tax=Haliotis cracherodii TaxID=6455 RepID=UPI0039EC328D